MNTAIDHQQQSYGMDKKKKTLQARLAAEMENPTDEGVEDLYLHTLAAISGKSAGSLRRSRDRHRKAGCTQPASQVGAALGMPSMWNLIGSMIPYPTAKAPNPLTHHE